jgi:hypothetical protein
MAVHPGLRDTSDSLGGFGVGKLMDSFMTARRALLLGLCAVMAACGGSDDPTEALPPKPVLETASATSADITPGGGVLEATAADGTRYRLEIPAGALRDTVRITMTPVTRIDNLPLSGGMVGAVDLQPAGLQLRRSAALRIGTTAPPRAGLTFSGFSVEDGGTKTTRELAVARANEVLVLVQHFSAPGAGFGTTQDLISLDVPSFRTAAEHEAWNGIGFIVYDPAAHPTATLRDAYLKWFDDVVLPMMQRANTDNEVLDAWREYENWKFVAPLDRIEGEEGALEVVRAMKRSIEQSEIKPRDSMWSLTASLKFKQAIQANNTLCAEQKSLSALANVSYLQQVAENNIDPEYMLSAGIDRHTVLRDLCAKLVVTARNLVQPLQIDQPHDLDLTFGLKFGTDPAVQAVPVQVSFQGDGVRFGKPSPANSNSLGEFTVAVTAEVSNAPVSMLLFGCLVLEGTAVTDVCVVEPVDRSSLDIQGQYKGTFRSTITTGSGQIVPVNVPINVTINQTQNGPQGTWEVMLFNGPRGSLSAILSGLELLNFNLNQFAPCQGLFTGSATIDTATRRIVANYSGSDCLGTHANGVTEILPGRIDGIDYNGTWGRFANGVLMHVFKVRQSGTQIDVSHMMRLGDNPANPLMCRAFYRATDVPGYANGFRAGFRAPGPGADPAPSEAAALDWREDLARVRGAIVDVYIETALPPFGQTGGAMIPLAAPPAGCNP